MYIIARGSARLWLSRLKNKDDQLSLPLDKLLFSFFVTISTGKSYTSEPVINLAVLNYIGRYAIIRNTRRYKKNLFSNSALLESSLISSWPEPFRALTQDLQLILRLACL